MKYEDYFKSKFPEEAVGYIKNGEFFPLENIASEVYDETGKVLFDKKNSFEVDPAFLLNEPEILLHSHTQTRSDPNLHPCTPSQSDLAGQLATAIEWGIVHTDGERVSEPVYWGNPKHRPPLEGRNFIFNVYDCFTLLQDFYFTEYGIELPNLARDPYWHKRNEDCIEKNYEAWGFKKVPIEERQRGDALLYVIAPSPVTRHIGIYMGDGTVLSHYYNEPSAVEPFDLRAQNIKLAVRHESCFAL